MKKNTFHESIKTSSKGGVQLLLMSFTLLVYSTKQLASVKEISLPDRTRLTLSTYRAPASTIDPKTIESPKFRFRKSEPETKERTGDDESIAVPAIYDAVLEPIAEIRTHSRTYVRER